MEKMVKQLTKVTEKSEKEIEYDMPPEKKITAQV